MMPETQVDQRQNHQPGQSRRGGPSNRIQQQDDNQNPYPYLKGGHIGGPLPAFVEVVFVQDDVKRR